MKTRRLAQAEDDPELNKTVKLAALLKGIWTAVTTTKGEYLSLKITIFLLYYLEVKSAKYKLTFQNKCSNISMVFTLQQLSLKFNIM